MKRLRYEWYALRGTFKEITSFKKFYEQFFVHGTYTDSKGLEKRGTYYKYLREFWLGGTK